MGRAVASTLRPGRLVSIANADGSPRGQATAFRAENVHGKRGVNPCSPVCVPTPYPSLKRFPVTLRGMSLRNLLFPPHGQSFSSSVTHVMTTEKVFTGGRRTKSWGKEEDRDEGSARERKKDADRKLFENTDRNIPADVATLNQYGRPSPSDPCFQQYHAVDAELRPSCSRAAPGLVQSTTSRTARQLDWRVPEKKKLPGSEVPPSTK